MHTEQAQIAGRNVSNWPTHLVVRLVHPEERDRWKTLMATYHYLGFCRLVGEALYYVTCLARNFFG